MRMTRREPLPSSPPFSAGTLTGADSHIDQAQQAGRLRNLLVSLLSVLDQHHHSDVADLAEFAERFALHMSQILAADRP